MIISHVCLQIVSSLFFRATVVEGMVSCIAASSVSLVALRLRSSVYVQLVDLEYHYFLNIGQLQLSN